ncbi:hypothetical protein C8J57DRAFT_1681114 [Mycena rebaudengoi]|nr:hypothetical protein C8J57DRAFT_1681114 [Mycena rebaudengoi]
MSPSACVLRGPEWGCRCVVGAWEAWFGAEDPPSLLLAGATQRAVRPPASPFFALIAGMGMMPRQRRCAGWPAVVGARPPGHGMSTLVHPSCSRALLYPSRTARHPTRLRAGLLDAATEAWMDADGAAPVAIALRGRRLGVSLSFTPSISLSSSCHIISLPSFLPLPIPPSRLRDDANTPPRNGQFEMTTASNANLFVTAPRLRGRSSLRLWRRLCGARRGRDGTPGLHSHTSSANGDFPPSLPSSFVMVANYSHPFFILYPALTPALFPGKPRFYLLPTLTSDVIPLPHILDGAVYNISGCTYSVTRGAGYTGKGAGGVGANGTRIGKFLHASSLFIAPFIPSASFLPTPRVCSFALARPLFRARPGRLSTLPLVRFSLLLLRSPLRLSLPPHPPFASPPDLPPNTPAYLAAFSGVSNATLGKILPPVMSARVSTRRKFERVEIRAKLPTGYWMWPALWVLPMDDVYGGWPLSGGGFLLGFVVIEHPGPVFDVIAAVLLIRRVAVICGAVPSQRRLTSAHDLRRDARRALLYPPSISLLFFASFFFLRPDLVSDARAFFSPGEIDIMEARGNGPSYPEQCVVFLDFFSISFLGGLGRVLRVAWRSRHRCRRAGWC